MQTMGQVLLALAVPIAWGIASAWAYDHLFGARQNKRGGKTANNDGNAGQCS